MKTKLHKITGIRGIRGYACGIRGDVSGITGDATGIAGNIDDCDLIASDRDKGVKLCDLMVEA